MQFYEIIIYQAMIFRLHTFYKKHDMMKIGNQMIEKSQYYRKCSNYFAADSVSIICIIVIIT